MAFGDRRDPRGHVYGGPDLLYELRQAEAGLIDRTDEEIAALRAAVYATRPGEMRPYPPRTSGRSPARKAMRKRVALLLDEFDSEKAIRRDAKAALRAVMLLRAPRGRLRTAFVQAALSRAA